MAEEHKTCHVCGKRISDADLAKERAITLLGKHYCASCANRKVKEKKTRRGAAGRRPGTLTLILVLAAVLAAMGTLFCLLLR